MNKYDEYYNFRLAKIADTDSIMKFISEEWGENHILAKNKTLFLWQHDRSEYNDFENLNYVLMTDKKNNILGIMGFVAYSDEKDKLQISGAIVKVKSSGLLPMTGVEFKKRMGDLIGAKIEFASGVNPITMKPIFEKVLKHKVGVMQQFYMLNPNVKEFKVAYIDKVEYLPVEDTGYSLKKISDFKAAKEVFDFEIDYEHMSHKSAAFINKRYFQHPIYVYEKWLVQNKEKETKGVLFGRVVDVDGTKVLRLVDYRGNIDDLYCIGKSVMKIIKENNFEYADLMVDYLDVKKMQKAGFFLLDVNGKNIIPNYFEPFERINIKNWYQNSGNVVIFKADGDQDRPNIL